MHNYDSYLGKSLYRLIKGALITNAQMGIETILALVNFLADLCIGGPIFTHAQM